jgi:tripartite-type tricarboxylate transporter receptor subunit TctC
MRSKSAATLLLALALAGNAAAIRAQAYPQRPIRIISPNSAAGANDTIGRIVALKLGEVLGQQVVIDNRGGAGGITMRVPVLVPRVISRACCSERSGAENRVRGI